MNNVLVRNILYAVVALMGLHLSAFAQRVHMVNAFPALTFNRPLYLTNSGDGTDRIFVVQHNRWWKWNERLWLEVMLWIINFVVIGWMVRRWKRINL